MNMDDFQDAVRTCFEKYVEFVGTAGRPEFWYFVLFVLLGNVALGIVDAILFGNGGFLGALFGLATFVPSIAVGARRLHDIGKSGWWQLIALVPVVGFLVLLYFYVQPSGSPGQYG